MCPANPRLLKENHEHLTPSWVSVKSHLCRLLTGQVQSKLLWEAVVHCLTGTGHLEAILTFFLLNYSPFILSNSCLFLTFFNSHCSPTLPKKKKNQVAFVYSRELNPIAWYWKKLGFLSVPELYFMSKWCSAIFKNIFK